MTIATNFRELLTGDKAFYKHPDYEEQREAEIASPKALPPMYVWNTESKAWRIAKEILSYIVFPIALYKLIHGVLGIAFMPACTKESTTFETDLHTKRITLEVDGIRVDATIAGTEDTFKKKRWVLAANANYQTYEETLSFDWNFYNIIKQTNSNAIVFNYPSVAGSSGTLPNKSATIKAYQVILRFLEDQENGLGAEELITFGTSIGGGIQNEAIGTYPLKDRIKHVSVNFMSFNDMKTTATHFVFEGFYRSIYQPIIKKFGYKPRSFEELKNSHYFSVFKPLALVVQLLGWNIESYKYSKKFKHPEIVIQSTHEVDGDFFTDHSHIQNDGMIDREASLANALLKDPDPESRKEKCFFGTSRSHCCAICMELVTQKINELLATA